MLPAFVGDLDVYQGDDYPLVVTFKDDAGDPIDMTGVAFTADVRGDEGVDVGDLAWSVDTTDAATGKIVMTLDGDDLALVTGPRGRVLYLLWDLAADGIYSRTLLEGRLALRTQV